MITALVFGVALQSGSLLQQIIPQPSGTNGYEEYLSAADMLETHEFQAFKAWDASLPKNPSGLAAPEGLTDTSSPLSRKRYEVENFGKALKLWASGNAKATSRGALSVMVEQTAFTDLSHLATDAAYVAYSKGDWMSGTTQLLSLLAFGDNVSKEGSAGFALGGKIESQCLTTFDKFKSMWSVSDCDRIGKRVHTILEGAHGAKIADPEQIQTRLRLLRLHAAVQSFKWYHGRLPTQLAEATPADDRINPITQEPFQYQVAGSGYKLFSKGVDGAEDITLSK